MKIVAVLDINEETLRSYDEEEYGTTTDTFSVSGSFEREMGWAVQSGIALEDYIILKERS